MSLFSGAPYDTCPGFVYVFTFTIILKLKDFVVNNILFLNIVMHPIGTPWGMVNIEENRVEFNRKCMFLC